MAVRSPYIRQWRDTFPIAIPRSRLNVGLSRRHMLIVLAILYLGVLVFIYLHLLGQVALVQYETAQTRAEWVATVEENARLEAKLAPYLSVAYIAQMSEGFEPIRVTYIGHTRRTSVAEQDTRHAADAPKQPAASTTFVGAWAQAFHLGKEPSGQPDTSSLSRR